jgi:hypothetical protein
MATRLPVRAPSWSAPVPFALEQLLPDWRIENEQLPSGGGHSRHSTTWSLASTAATAVMSSLRIRSRILKQLVRRAVTRALIEAMPGRCELCVSADWDLSPGYAASPLRFLKNMDAKQTRPRSLLSASLELCCVFLRMDAIHETLDYEAQPMIHQMTLRPLSRLKVTSEVTTGMLSAKA